VTGADVSEPPPALSFRVENIFNPKLQARGSVDVYQLHDATHQTTAVFRKQTDFVTDELYKAGRSKTSKRKVKWFYKYFK
jgi:hypothetical protein